MAQVSFNFSENREHIASVAPLSPPVTEAGHTHTHHSSDWRKVETAPCLSLGVTDGGELALPVLSAALRIVTTIHSRLLAHSPRDRGSACVISLDLRATLCSDATFTPQGTLRRRGPVAA